MGGLREANAKHTGGIKTKMFSEKGILSRIVLEKSMGLKRYRSERSVSAKGKTV